MHTLLVFLPTMPLSPVYIPESLPKQTAYTKALATAPALGEAQGYPPFIMASAYHLGIFKL